MRALRGGGIRIGAALAPILLALLSSGCLPWHDRAERRLNEIAFETHAQSRQQDAMAAEIAEIQEMLASEGLDTDEGRAELLTRLRTLEATIEQLNARSQEQEQLLRRMSAAIDQIARGGAPAPLPPALAEADSATSAAPTDSAEAAPPADSPPELLLYDAATRDFRRGNYILARSGFEELAHRYPNSQLADNATYWLGETLYAEADYTAALVRYEEVMELYPTSDTLPSALLKSAYCHLELENRDGAVAAFRGVLREFPDTDEATNAAHRLTALGIEP